MRTRARFAASAAATAMMLVGAATSAFASDPVGTLKRDLNPAACPAFIELANDTGGGVFGAVLFNPSDGDVYLAQPTGRGYTREWDCPPYAN